MDFEVLETVKNGRKYRDVVVKIEGHDFILKPAPFYSLKAKHLFDWLLSTLTVPPLK